MRPQPRARGTPRGSELPRGVQEAVTPSLPHSSGHRSAPKLRPLPSEGFCAFSPLLPLARPCCPRSFSLPVSS